jgi:hypothetical protein
VGGGGGGADDGLGAVGDSLLHPVTKKDRVIPMPTKINFMTILLERGAVVTVA